MPIVRDDGRCTDKPAERYIYATYSNCDFAKQERYDEIFDEVQKPVLDAAMKDGSINTYSYLSHQTGGQWRRASVHGAGSVQALLDAQKKMGDQADSNDKNKAGRRGERDLPVPR